MIQDSRTVAVEPIVKVVVSKAVVTWTGPMILLTLVNVSVF